MKRQLIALGLASILTVPTWISLAYPTDASAKKATVSKKSKAVITKIKAIKANKANYIKTTNAAKVAYNKLSKTDKKAVSNYKTLQKHMKATSAIVVKANKVKKDAAAISTKNYKTTAPKVQKAYNALNIAGKAYLSTGTVNKINSYMRLATANTTMAKLTIAADPTTTTNSAQEISNFIDAYEKLTANQKIVLQGFQDKIDYFLGFKPIVKKAIAFDTKYEKLNPSGSGYLKPAYDLYTTFMEDKSIEADVVFNDITTTPPTVIQTHTVTVEQMTKHANDIQAIKSKIAKEYAIKEAFEQAVVALPGTANQYNLVLAAEKAYKAANATSANGVNLLGKPIEIVDKKVMTEYKKYENIPDIVAILKAAEDYASKNNFATTNEADLLTAGFTAADVNTIAIAGKIAKDKDITALDTVVKNYAKLGADQKVIVDAEVGAKKDYANDSALFKKGQTISKAYTDALAKNDLAAMMKQFDAYKALVASENRTIRYIAASNALSIAPKTYKAQLDRVAAFETSMGSYTTIAAIQKLKTDYTAIEKDKPSGVKLIDSKVAKDYTLALSVLEIEKLMKKISAANVKPTYTTKKLNYALAAVKLYNKLDQPKKDIIDGLTYSVADHTVEDYSLEEKNIKTAMDIDKKYLALKKASKNYIKDVNAVYNDYLNANNDVKKYLINTSGLNALESVLTTPKTVVTNFETAVNNAYEEVYTNDITNIITIANLKNIKNTYENKIKPYPKYNGILDADVLKKYKSLAPIIDVYNQIFYLKPTPKTEVERENILTAIKAYNKLDSFGKAVIEIEAKLGVNLQMLDDEPAIAQAKKIDAAYKAVKVGDKNYEQKIHTVYKSYVQAQDDVKNYVLNKTVLNSAAAKYAATINAAEKFEKAFDEIDVNSAIIHIHELKNMYEGNKKIYPEIDQFINADKLKMYKKYLDLLTLQDVAQIVYNQQLISGDWVKYDAWFYTYGQTQDHKADVQNMRKVLLAFRTYTPIQLAILNNSPNYDSYTGMKEDKNGDNIPIYNASGTTIIGYEKELNFGDKFAPKEVIYNPVDWLNYTQIQYVLEAIELEKRFTAMKPSSKSYVRDAMKLVVDYNASALPVQVYFLYSAELKTLETQYKTPLANAVAFETAVKNYNPNTEKLAGLATAKAAYNALDTTALAIVDASILKTYLAYIAAEDANFAFAKVKIGLTPATMNNNANTVDFIAKYNKLSADGKKIVQNENATKVAEIDKLVSDEKDLKAAQTVDKKYEALDQTKPTYEADLMKLYDEYAKLSATAQSTYSVYGPKLTAFYAKYVPGQSFGTYTDNPSTTADYFTKIVNSLDSASPYLTVKAASDLYNYLAEPQIYASDSTKKVVGLNFVKAATITKYKQYEGLVTISNAFDQVRDYAAVKSYTVKEKDAILVSIAAYKKLPKDVRTIFDNDSTFGVVEPAVPEAEKRYLVLVEADIKVAATVDTKFQKIKKGDATFAKNMIDAMKSYEGLSELQKKFFTEQSIYNTYKSKYGMATSYTGKVDTIPEGIKAIVDFENAIKHAQELHEAIVQTPLGVTVTKAQTQEVIDAIVVANTHYNFMNRDFVIEGQKLRLANLANSQQLTDYKTLMNLYKVSKYLDDLKK